MDDALVATSIFYTVYDFDFKMMQHGNLRVSKVLTNHPERNINIHGYPFNQMSALWWTGEENTFVIEIIVIQYQETMSLCTHSNSKPPTVVEMVYQRTN